MEKSLVAVALNQPTERCPVWFMRQAGRYLPEYREVRQKFEFLELCKTPKWAAEVTLQPLRRYDLDAAIIFSDILIPAVAMGQQLTFDKGHGPELSHAVRSSADLLALKQPHAEKDMGFVGDAIAATKAQLKPHQTMIGFAGAPFTVASYMIEGGSSKNFTEVKKLLYRDPQVFKGLMTKLVDTTVSYLAMQVKAGADALMLFDSWAGQLTVHDYTTHVLPHVQELLKQIRPLRVPLIYYPGQGCDRLPYLNDLAVDVVSIDWRTSLTVAHKFLKDAGLDVALQGNLDPQILIAEKGLVQERVRMILQEVKSIGVRHIFNVGHGLLPHIPPEALTWVIEEIRAASRN